MTDVIELTEEDLAMLPRANSVGIADTPVPSVKSLRDSHHSVARLLAKGLRDVEVAAITGYTPTRVGQLKRDPAFQELLAHYRAEQDLAAADLTERMLGMNLDVLQEMQRRLDEEPETFTNGDLRETFKVTADRSGFGAKTTQLNINVELAARLSQARQRVDSVALRQLEGTIDNVD